MLFHSFARPLAGEFDAGCGALPEVGDFSA